MSQGSRPLRWACRLGVAVWLLAGLAWRGGLAVSATPVVQAAARVRPVAEKPPPPPPSPEPPPPAPSPRPPVSEPEPEPEGAPQPPPEPPAKPSPEPAAPTPVGGAELARGDALLDAAGAFPALSCSYEDFGSFGDYARAMASLGARFVVVRRREIVATADVESGALHEAAVGSGFSPRARDYTGEPGLTALARAARERFGGGAVVMMLVPRPVDAGLFGGIARALSERGEQHDGFREILGRYERGPAGGVRLRIDAAVRRDGARLPLELLFDLGEIVGAAGRGARA